ncbi:PAAR domain-containing protein [Massilia horti]|uniref:PAAR domain-containing protein n=1 Tax=Massilia horti TaxID=2562153 RepID=A0A4Y9SZ83_9BURK|nr:PAAR domain-containing protein [Massilia horti]TFW32184.1 PAAR domain-containing protein [Massilia horti]
MSLPWIVMGDKTSHGGTVIEGAPTFATEGKQVALVGHMTTCPKCMGGPFPIVTGAPDFVCNGRSVARHGDKTACGASLISGQVVSWWGAETSAPGGEAVLLTIVSALDYDEHFVLLDKNNMKPVEGFAYAITTSKGEQEGRTGADGKTVHVESEKPETVTLNYAVQLQIGIRI